LGRHRERWCGSPEGRDRYARCVPAGNPSGPEPAEHENVRDQVMRTLSAVRTRLRGTNPDANGGEPGDAEHHGNGDRGLTAPEPPRGSPRDRLLADPPANGHGPETLTEPPVAEAIVAGGAAASVIDAPPEVEPDLVPVEPIPAGGDPGGATAPRRQ